MESYRKISLTPLKVIACTKLNIVLKQKNRAVLSNILLSFRDILLRLSGIKELVHA